MKRTALYKRVRKAIEKDLNENNIRWFDTQRYTYRSYRGSVTTRNMPIDASYSTIHKALEDMRNDGLLNVFGNGHTVNLYVYIPNMKKWALELESDNTILSNKGDNND